MTASVTSAAAGTDTSTQEVKPSFRFSASYAQQRLWFIDQLDPGLSTYNVPVALRIQGKLDIGALKNTFQEIVNRHESLRTTFSGDDAEPQQVVWPALELDLPIINLQSLPAAEREPEARKYAMQEAGLAFDLVHGPLLRVKLVQLDEQDHVLVVTLHHIICDAWSVAILIREVSALYGAFSKGKPSPLPALPLQYVDYTAWQRKWLQGDALNQQIEYWKRQLAGVEPLELPTDRPRPQTFSYRGGTETARIAANLLDKTKELGRQQGATLYITLLAAFHALLYRYTGQQDVTVGSPIAGRRRPEMEALIGFFVNTLVLRAHVSGGATFKELLQQVKETTLQAFAHQDVPFEKLVEILQPERDLSRPPLFQVMLVLQNVPPSALEMAPAKLSPFSLGTQTAKFELTLILAENNSELQCSLGYSNDLFDAGTAQRMLEHFQKLLSSIVAGPHLRLGELLLLTENEKQTITHWNRTGQSYPLECSVYQLFEQQVLRTPNELAVTYEAERLTYAELNARSNQLAHYLRMHAVGPDQRVGICMNRSLEMIVGLMGILKAGGAYIPLDPTYPQERLSYMLENSGMRVLLTENALKDLLPTHSARTVTVDTAWKEISNCRTDSPGVQVLPENIAYVIYTSGSTGKPKGVALPHRAISNLIHWQVRNFEFTLKNTLQFTSLSFDVSVQEIFSTLIAGGVLHLIDDDVRRDIPQLRHVIAQKQIERIFLPFVALDYLSKAYMEESSPECRLREVITAGEQLQITPAIQQLFRQNQDAVLVNHYGPSETHLATFYTLRGDSSNWPKLPPVGKGIANFQLHVLNGWLEPAPVGVSGELFIAGAGMARGYLNNPDLTAERFLPNPFSYKAGDRLYKTGDIVRWRQDGELEFLGRIDGQVKIRGYRIELGEIESVLRQHPSVEQAVVVVQQDESRQKRLIGYVVLRQQITSDELREAIQKRLPEYMVPSVFMVLKSIPLTPTGKTDRRALPSPVPETGEKETYVAPRTPSEESLTKIWTDVLGRTQISMDDDFFALGGHSLLATQVTSRIRKVFQIEVPLRRLFEAPTIAKLAKVIEQLAQPFTPADNAPLAHKTVATTPLSYAQQRLWFIDQLTPGHTVYHIPAAIRILGPLDLQALQKTLDEIVRRHESLRTRFTAVDGEAMQVIDPPVTLPLAPIDLSFVPATEREAKAKEIALEEIQTPFDLSRGPLFRVKLLRIAEDDHVLVTTMHHIISDGWSIGVLMREVSMLYEAFSAGRPSPLPELPIQYRDYAAWQRKWLSGKVLEKQISYWKQQLAGVETLDLPADYPRPALVTYNGASERLTITPEVTEKLRKIGQRQGATLYMTVLAAWQVLLARYSGQQDIAVGSPVAGRRRSELEGLIGVFINTVVLRAHVSDDVTFKQLLQQVKETALRAFAHQDVPFEKLVEILQPERDLSRTPLFQVMFVMQNTPQASLQLGAARLEGFPLGGNTTKFDLSLNLSEVNGALQGGLNYNTDLFAAASVRRMIGHWQALLRNLALKPERPVGELDMLDQAERRQLLLEWNRTKVEYQQRCVHELFAEQAARTPEAVAVEFEGEEMNYAELNRRANQLGNYLRRLGVAPEVRIGICLERSFEMMVSLLAILKAGGAYLPLDPGYPRDHLRYLIEDAQLSVLLTNKKFETVLPSNAAHTICIDEKYSQIAIESDAEPGVKVDPANLAYVIFTSGSSGKPKGVMLTHWGLDNHMRWIGDVFRISHQDRMLQKTALTFDASVWELFAPLLKGGCLVLAKPGGQRDADYLLQCLAEERITVIQLVPSQLEMLVQTGGLERCRSLRLLCCGGEALSAELVNRVSQLAPWAQWYNLYGPTEATIDATFGDCANKPGRVTALIGKPIANLQTYVLDRNLELVPVGIKGELHIGGAGLARGYLNRPDLTAERFLPNPFSYKAGDRLYKTGDIVRWRQDGELEFLGRIDGQVKIRGYRIELGEIESVLRQHPSVEQAVVVVQQDESRQKRLIGYVVLRQQITSDELREAIQKRLPEYMVPSVFMVLESIPLAPSGKIDRRALPAPVPETGEKETYVAPRTPTEELVTQIWTGVLGRTGISMDDDFFAVGGHSLLATQVTSRIRKVFQIEVPLRRLFETPTIAKLAKVIDELGRQTIPADNTPLVHKISATTVPLSYAQQRLWFIDQLTPGHTVYHIPAAIRILGPLDLQALQKTLDEIVRRHESLRTRFTAVDGEAMQVIDPPATLPLAPIDLSFVPATEREAKAKEIVLEEIKAPFDLSRGPLFRVKLLRIAEDDHVLVTTMHHIISDGWSIGVLMREVSMLYEAFSAGRPSPLPELPIQYRDYAAWQRKWLSGEILEKQISYWKQQLAGLETLDLPTDYPRPALVTYNGAGESISIPSDLTEKLRSLGQRQGTTLYMTLLAAWQVMLGRYSAQEDVAVGSLVAGRRWAEMEGLIGFFINTLVLRNHVRASLTFSQLLHLVRETTLQAYAHQDVPFEKLVEILQPERDLSRTPLFQVMFVMQNTPQASLQLGAARLEGFALGGNTAKFDLTLNLTEANTGLQGGVVYNTDLFAAASVRRMIGHWQALLRNLASKPERPVGELDMLDQAEHRQLLVEWNRTQVRYPQLCVHEQFAEHAARTPQAVAVEYEGQEMNYAELNRRANQLGNYLRKLGVRPEVRVGICLERSLEMVVGLMGILKSGGAYVPLDPTYPQDRLAYTLADAQVSLLLTQERFRSQFSNSQSSSYAGKVVALDSEWDAIAAESDANPQSGAGMGNLVYVIYTSGSTGQPKGAMNVHSGLNNRLLWMQQQYGLNESDRVLQKTAFTFDVSVWEFFWPLMRGARLVMARPGGHQDPEYLSAIIQSAKITTLHFVPSMLNVWLESEGAGRCSTLRRVICSGEALSLEAQKKFQSRLKAELHNLYGPTEASIDVTFWHCREDWSAGYVPIGRPIANTQVYVLDGGWQPVPVGVKGELYLGGAGLARGYLGRPELTAERFIPNAYASAAGERLYRTGDQVRWKAEGQLEFLGRLDHQVKLRGFRIELGEIEARLLEHPGVREAVVLAREDAPGDKRLAAYVVPDAAHAFPVLQLLRLEQSGELPPSARYELPNSMVISHQNKSETDFVYREIFEQETYLRHGITLRPDARVFDVGANIGLFTLAVLQRAPQAQVYAFEPIPPVFESLRINSLLSGREVHLFNCGLSSAAGNARFTWFKHNSVISGRYADLEEEQETIKAFMKNQAGAEITEEALENLIRERLEQQQFQCSLRTVSEVMAAEKIDRIDLLKVDVEKSEFEVIEGINEGDWHRIAQLVVEVHDIHGRLNKMRQLFVAHGYEVTVEQDELLASTNLYTIFARRPERAEQNGASSQLFSLQPAPLYWSTKQLTAALREHLSARLPEYMVPAAFVMLEKFPLNASGKLDRKALPAPEKEGRGRKYEEPVGETEKALAEIFQKVLRIEKVGRHDSFFELGGHSLLAVRLRAGVRNRLNHDLSLVDIFQNPTIAKMAQRTELSAQDLRPQILVPLQPLGSQTPFFCVHAVGGQVLSYSVLARELGRERPFYGLQSPASDSAYGTLDTVEQMASAYIQEIRQVQPHGPYILGGWSMGGLVAFEMARQLRAAGEPIALLALFDTYPPARNRAIAGSDSPSVTLARFALEMARMMGRNITDLQSKFDQSSLEEQKKLVMDELVRGEMVPRDNAEAEFNHLLNVYTRNLQAMARYSPPPQDQSILLFKASESEDSQVVGEQWKASSIREVELHLVSGNHYTILQQPVVANVASTLSDWLKRLPKQLH